MRSARRIAPIAVALAVVGLVAVLVTASESQRATAGAPFPVNTTVLPGDGTCDDTECTLEEAIMAAGDGGTVSFSIPDTDQGCVAGICTIKPTEALVPLGFQNMTVDGYTQPGASPNTAGAFQPTNANIRIVVDGSDITTGSAYGLWVANSGITIRGLSIVNFGEEGIKTGTFPHSAIVRGNFIGILPDGETAAGNDIGVHIMSSQSGNAIGGDSPADRNVVSGNANDGLYATAGEGLTISNNFVGTNAAGTSAVPNGRYGINLGNRPMSLIYQNLVSGNGSDGIRASGTDDITIANNRAGTNAAGNGAVANGGHGIHLHSVTFSLVGIIGQGVGNLASGNVKSGIALTNSDDNNVKGNRIGTNLGGASPLPNQDHGVYLDQGSDDNTIGGEFDVDEENIIAFNGKAGVALSPAAGIDNYIDPSSTHSNAGLGVDLLDDGQVLANDADDSDTGPNDLMNYPVINSAEWNGSTLSVNATLTTVPSKFYNLFIFVNRECDPSGYGEGERFLVSHPLSSGATGSASFTKHIPVSDIADMEFVTMSASNPESTSEFSKCEPIDYTGPETPTASPTPSPSPTSITSPTPSGTGTSAPTPSPSDTGSPFDTGTPSPTSAFTPTPTPTASIGMQVIWSNLDCTGNTNPVDALKALRADAGLSVTQPAGCPSIGSQTQVNGQTRTWGDVDCNLALTPVDGLKILRFDAALPVSQEPGCPGMNEIVTLA
ncbi:MAG TPA: right-handed parallel beta-helix repeat-containing protein [Dehalococcoidia bacterium]|nr:right-handed parallel beta-helix repeat-containing protein [Dehalococcoidia bacterium]